MKFPAQPLLFIPLRSACLSQYSVFLCSNSGLILQNQCHHCQDKVFYFFPSLLKFWGWLFVGCFFVWLFFFFSYEVADINANIYAKLCCLSHQIWTSLTCFMQTYKFCLLPFWEHQILRLSAKCQMTLQLLVWGNNKVHQRPCY